MLYAQDWPSRADDSDESLEPAMENLVDGRWNTNPQRLRMTFTAALVFHFLLLIGLGFTLPSSSNPSPSLDVTLVQYHSDDTPDKADFIAQSNQFGSGDQAQALQATTDLQSPLESQDHFRASARQQRRPELSAQVVASHSGNGGISQNDESDNLSAVYSEDRDIDAMRAELDRLKQAYSKLPRVLRMTSVSAKSTDEAAYMQYFEQRVEQVGNVNYPREARSRGMFGRVQLVVVLMANGDIKRIEVSKSSGSRLLDQAAVRSVQLASPFKAFPAELYNRDEIHIIRTWQYQSNNVLTTN
ncbi:energy transducer TonB [bacterium]|nr:energy transducer TonB [bacterium]